MKPVTREPSELEALEGLKLELCGLCMHSIELMVRLARARRDAVPDRLACVLHDCLIPALHDLGSIVAEAREHARPAKGRRPDVRRAAARRSR